MTGERDLQDALISFAIDGQFPENIDSLPSVSKTDLTSIIQALEENKTKLEKEIHVINEETKEEVASWVKNSKSLQDDIIESKSIAHNLVRQSETPDVSGETIKTIEARAEFLNREIQYSQQLRGILQQIRQAKQLLDNATEARSQRKVPDALQLLEDSWTALDHIGVGSSSRVVKLLHLRAVELKSSIYEVLTHTWNALIKVDIDACRIIISNQLEEEHTTLSDAFKGFQAYKEVDERMEQLWRNVDAAIISRRMNPREPPKSIRADGDTLTLQGESSVSIDSLMSDLEIGLRFFATKLTPESLESFSGFLTADVVPRLIEQWLVPAVPSSLQDMQEFQAMIARSTQFHTALYELGYAGIDSLREWVENTPTLWLSKCRQTALDSIRASLAKGIGSPKQVEKIEKQMVSIAEGKTLATTGAGAVAEANDWGDNWGDAWDDGQTGEHNSTLRPRSGQIGESDPEPVESADDGVDAWGWDDDAESKEKTGTLPLQKAKDERGGDEDDAAEAWGWGEDDKLDDAPEPQKQPESQPEFIQGPEQQTRELILKETYNISSLPDVVLELLVAILEDGATLTKGNKEYEHIAKTSAGLFGLPTFALALFRALSPYYYSLEDGGNMYLYNDAIYLAEKLSELSSSWQERDELTVRAKALLRLDNDIQSLRSFANRSYAGELNLQRTVLRDFLGGTQSLIQQDDSDGSIEAATARLRQIAAAWEPILARSVWSQAVGSLADTIAIKFITDVLEMSSIGQDEAYNVAQLIASAMELDDLFLPSKLAGQEAVPGEVPWTSQYAPNWLRLKFLSEFLQSNLNEVKDLWLEGGLSLQYSLQEVIDLIQASFADSSRTRDTIKLIRAQPQPMAK